jgi:hypothetical protein
MHKWIAFLLLVFAPDLRAQSFITISPQQCMWRAGDDQSWAAANLDESGWRPYAQWKLNPAEPRIWVRCHADLSPLLAISKPTIQVSLPAAYRLYVGGVRIGEAGNVRTGNFSMNVIRQYPLPATALQAHPSGMALEISYRYSNQLTPGVISRPPNAEIRIGDVEALAGLRAQAVLAAISTPLVNAACFGLIGVVGLMLLGLFYYDRSRPELLFLSIQCATLAFLRAREFSVADQWDLPSAINLFLFAAGNMIVQPAALLFYFSLARRRVPLIYWLAIAVDLSSFASLGISQLLPVRQASSFLGMQNTFELHTDLGSFARLFGATSAFAAFWPYSRIARRMRPLAVACIASSAVMTTWFAVEMTGNSRWGLPNFFTAWRADLLEMRALATACVLVALLALLLRDQQQAIRERAILAGEMQAASEIQQMLAPATIETAPGLRIAVAFHPMRDVGGDFYLCRELADGRQRVLIGDVSGKGAAAAMAATLILGAAAARDRDAPGTLLAQLNRVLKENHLSGFATCLCADVATDGSLTLANAGHLPPYRNGREIELDSGLPLGIASGAEYAESTIRLNAGDALTFLSDGVVEARNASGELFGFERTAAISTESAQNIASAAQRHGQVDDITVLTLQRMVPA